MIYSPVYELNNFCFQGPAIIFIGVPRQFWTIPPVTFAWKGNDPRKILRGYKPRPVFGGICLGSNQNFIENVDESYEEVPQAGNAPVPLDLRVQTEVTGGEGIINYSDDPLINPYFRPNGIDQGAYWTWGGKQETKKTSILVVRINDLKKIQTHYEAHYYPRVVLATSPIETSARKVSQKKLKFRVVAALQEDGCPMPFGQQSAICWYFRINPDGSNSLVHPLFPDSDEWQEATYAPFF